MLKNKYSKLGFNYYLRNHLFLLMIVLGCFVLGIVAGSIAVNNLDYQQKEELVNYLNQFTVQINKLVTTQQNVLVQKLIISNLKFILMLWFLGLTVVGSIVAPVIIALRGFILGFTISFLIKELFLKGFLLAAISILPQNLIIVPSLLLGCLFTLIYASLIGKNWFFNLPRLNYSFGQILVRYSALMLGLAGLLFVASLIEAYVTPNLVKFIANFLIN
ncbi:stage II sporulation protein M [Halanaerocella petrolearia]